MTTAGHPEVYRERARRLRDLAASETAPDLKKQLAEVAEQYERMAKKAEDGAPRGPTTIEGRDALPPRRKAARMTPLEFRELAEKCRRAAQRASPELALE